MLPLHDCSFFGADLDVLGIILDHTDINSTTIPQGNTALMIATYEYRDNVCDYLLSRDASTEAVNGIGENIWNIAIHRNNHKMIQLLPQYRTNLCNRTNSGETLLHYAAQFGDLECLEILHLLNLDGLNTYDTVTESAPTQQLMKNLKGLTALQIAERRTDMSPEWHAMFRKLIQGIECPESKIQLAATASETEETAGGEVEEFHDAIGNQNP